MFIRKYFLSFELKGQIQNYLIKFIFQFDKKVEHFYFTIQNKLRTKINCFYGYKKFLQLITY